MKTNSNSIMTIALTLVLLGALATADARAEEKAELSVSFSNVKTATNAPAANKVLPAATNTIVDIAVADGRFTTLVTALQEAGLVETLQGDGPFTVFAPTDAAFAALPQGTVEALLGDKPALTDVLLYHVVAGRVLAGDVVGLQRARTVQGTEVKIGLQGSSVFLNGASQVVITDIVASNGVIHVIDSVLLPSQAADPVGTLVPATLEVSNKGGKEALDFFLTVTSGKRMVYKEKINSLHPGTSRFVNFSFYPVKAGEYELKASVDTTGSVDESSELNNSATATYLASEVDGRDLLITDVDIEKVAASAPAVGDYLVSFRMYNVGTKRAGGFDYRVYLTNASDRIDKGAELLLNEDALVPKVPYEGGQVQAQLVVFLFQCRDTTREFSCGALGGSAPHLTAQCLDLPLLILNVELLAPVAE